MTGASAQPPDSDAFTGEAVIVVAGEGADTLTLASIAFSEGGELILVPPDDAALPPRSTVAKDGAPVPLHPHGTVLSALHAVVRLIVFDDWCFRRGDAKGVPSAELEIDGPRTISAKDEERPRRIWEGSFGRIPFRNPFSLTTLLLTLLLLLPLLLIALPL